ncbi:hypothetical protein AMATHDRAFT_4869 [Amanita thiersii Skay4041]|uniref:Uncharacterized protein n=1 Tax=Amanita thiersii Skay4041 TaxID=703135 RepID=A0A2A9NHD4_9AGAR|nr:hypothetical protein AMATHDRAFT_4869 [Amanita thiersii Skay4041]
MILNPDTIQQLEAASLRLGRKSPWNRWAACIGVGRHFTASPRERTTQLVKSARSESSILVGLLHGICPYGKFWVVTEFIATQPRPHKRVTNEATGRHCQSRLVQNLYRLPVYHSHQPYRLKLRPDRDIVVLFLSSTIILGGKCYGIHVTGTMVKG